MKEPTDSIRPDQDEIRTYHHTHSIHSQGIGLGTAIVLAAIIGIGGFWGGKIGYAMYLEWRAEQAMKQVAQAMQAAQQRAQEEQQRRIQAAKRAAAAAEKARRDKIWNSRACKFWWEHDPKNPAVIAKARTMQTCHR
ncbi:hypothetical protein [Stutzerimonas kirkiae]|uniref:hypothetical protein n=1 Tax=Stutzerimonas kirkiae TaxID=2211392 RepID=UPI00103837AF|nr:hypothetical protein [Stutzerimonas kirkiae]TBV13203.1 hypothetical protein DNK01_12150 [Stutzerimonas kirkiae]